MIFTEMLVAVTICFLLLSSPVTTQQPKEPAISAANSKDSLLCEKVCHCMRAASVGHQNVIPHQDRHQAHDCCMENLMEYPSDCFHSLLGIFVVFLYFSSIAAKEIEVWALCVQRIVQGLMERRPSCQRHSRQLGVMVHRPTRKALPQNGLLCLPALCPIRSKQ